MKRITMLLVPVAVILIAGLALVACAPAAPPGEGPAPAPPPEKIKIRFAYWQPMTCTYAVETFDPWVKTIEERTNGRVEMEVMGAGALGGQFELYDMCTQGATDIHSFAWMPRFEATAVMHLPFLYPSSTVASLVANDLGLKYFQQYDTPDQKVLWYFTNAPYEIHSRTKFIKTLEDFKGMKVNSVGGMVDEIVSALGGTPVALNAPDVYTALESGLLDAATLEWEGAWAWKWALVTKYRTVVPKSQTLYTMGMHMNWDTWNSLPPDIQKIFEEESGAKWAYVAGEGMDRWNKNNYYDIIEYDKGAGNPLPYYHLPADEMARWEKATNPVIENWIATVEAKGIPGRQILEEAKMLRDKYAAQYPPEAFED